MKRKIMLTTMAFCMISYVGVYGMESAAITNRVSGDVMYIETLNKELFNIITDPYDTETKKVIIEDLLNRGANINAIKSGIPLLSYAIQNFKEFDLDIKFIEFLIDNDADLNQKDILFRTPLKIAKELKLYDVYGLIEFKQLMKN